jgi:hypothetical protein
LLCRISLAASVAILCVVGLAPATLAVNTSLAGEWVTSDGSVYTCPTTCGTITLTRMATSTQPVLGTTSFGAPSAQGFGTVKPKTVFLGGDPTGLFKHLSWKQWGKKKATGHGTGFYDPPGKPTAESVKAKVTLVASSLGECQGTLAYRKLAVSFLYHHREHAGTRLNLCS